MEIDTVFNSPIGIQFRLMATRDIVQDMNASVLI